MFEEVAGILPVRGVHSGWTFAWGALTTNACYRSALLSWQALRNSEDIDEECVRAWAGGLVRVLQEGRVNIPSAFRLIQHHACKKLEGLVSVI